MCRAILSLISLLCFSMLTVSAQKTVTVKSFVQTTDHIPSSDRRNDLNGVPCALIKVYVVDDIERIEGNKIGNIVKKGNVEKWVYICKGSRNMKIHLKNHLPVLLKFQDYKINGLESNRVYELIIELSDMSISANSTIFEKKQEMVNHNESQNDQVTTMRNSVLGGGNNLSTVGKRIVNYRFDFTQMYIDRQKAEDYIASNLCEGKSSIECYQNFLAETEQMFISSANEKSLLGKGYILNNNVEEVIEVVIIFGNIDEDGEHTVCGIVMEKSSQNEIARLKAHTGGGGNNFKKNFPKRLRKTGEIFGDKLADNVLRKRYK